MISLRLPISLFEQIKIAARKRDVPYKWLIKMWLSEKVGKGWRLAIVGSKRILAITGHTGRGMPVYSIAKAKDDLAKLIDEAAAGEEVVITRHGKVVAYVRPAVERPIRQPPHELVAKIVERPNLDRYWRERGRHHSPNARRRIRLIYFDASVLMSLLVADAHTEKASAWYSGLSAATIVSGGVRTCDWFRGEGTSGRCVRR